MNTRNVARNGKDQHERNLPNNDRKAVMNSQKICKRAPSSASSPKSPPKLVLTAIVWTLLTEFFRFVRYLITSLINCFYSTNNKDKTTTRKRGVRVSVSTETCDISRTSKGVSGSAYLRKTPESISRLKPPPVSLPKKVDAFTTVDLWLTGDVGEGVEARSKGNHFSSADSGIGSRPVSRADTNETSSECCTEESAAISKRPRSRRSRFSGDQLSPGSNATHESRALKRARQGISVASSCYVPASVRQDMSITRHIVRVRSGRSKRAKSVGTSIRRAKSEREPETGSGNTSTFYEDYDEFY